jgi:hypothetical protein
LHRRSSVSEVPILDEYLCDLRYKGLPKTRVCRPCGRKLHQTYFYPVRERQRGEGVYKLNAWCRTCSSSKMREHRLRTGQIKRTVERVHPDLIRDELVFLYGVFESYRLVHNETGMEVSAIQNICTGKHKLTEKKHVEMVHDAYASYIADLPEDQIEKYKQRGLARIERNRNRLEGRKEARLNDDWRKCERCERTQILEEFVVRTKRMPNGRKKKYMMFVCMECERNRVRKAHNTDPDNFQLPVTPRLMRIAAEIRERSLYKGVLHRHGIADSVIKGLVSGRYRTIRAKNAERVLRAYAEVIDKY